MNNPVFTVTPKTLDLVAKIAETVGELQGSGEYARNLHLRKVNRLRSIQSSLAIESNSLSIEQVSDIVNGKRVLGKPSEIKEVKNAYEAYEHLLEYSPYKTDDFLKAHTYMTQDLEDESGRFRSKGVGVFSGDKLVHAGAKAEFVPKLIADLLIWAGQTDIHPLIRSSVVHFEIELIHPFADGNGRIGRLWQTLILAEWNELFAWLPVETIVFQNQQAYYDVLHTAGKQADAGVFIEFMLDVIYQALAELPIRKLTDIFPDISTDNLTKTELEFLEQIAGYLDRNKEISNYRAQILTNRSAESIKKYLARFVKLSILKAIGENKGRKYAINNDKPV